MAGSDIDEAKAERATRELGVRAVAPDAIYDVACDVYGPYALGATINDQTIPRLRCRIVCGSANNLEERLAHQARMHEFFDRGSQRAPGTLLARFSERP